MSSRCCCSAAKSSRRRGSRPAHSGTRHPRPPVALRQLECTVPRRTAEQRRPAVTASRSRRKRPASRSLVPGVLLGLADPSERKGSTTVVGGRQRSAISRPGGAAALTTRVSRCRGRMISAPRWSRSQAVKACEVQSVRRRPGRLPCRRDSGHGSPQRAAASSTPCKPMRMCTHSSTSSTTERRTGRCHPEPLYRSRSRGLHPPRRRCWSGCRNEPVPSWAGS